MICPLCSQDIKEIKIISNNEWMIFSCPICSNAWTFPSPVPLEYSKEDFHNGITEEDLPREWTKSLNMQKKLVKKYLEQGKKILEIGCGNGLLLKNLEILGYDVSGMEPSFSAAELAKSKGLKVYCESFPGKLLKDKKFDLIIMSHVLEHLVDPIYIVKEIKKYLNPDGLFLLIQTNYNSIIPKLQKRNWYAWVPEQHYWHFTPKGLVDILEREGFCVQKIEKSSIVHGRKFSLISLLIPRLGDQFHLIAKI